MASRANLAPSIVRPLWPISRTSLELPRLSGHEPAEHPAGARARAPDAARRPAAGAALCFWEKGGPLIVAAWMTAFWLVLVGALWVLLAGPMRLGRYSEQRPA